MATVSISAARESLAEMIEKAEFEAVFLERHGKQAAVLVSPTRYDQLMSALEDSEDVLLFDEAMVENAENIPWDEVMSDLGWN